mgnify:FL=1
MPVTNIKHGTINAYNRDKCRCDDCKKTKAEYAKRSRDRSDYHKRYYAENTEKCKEATRRWRAKNPGRSVEKAREWNVANRERYNANMRNWRANNKDKVAEQNRNLKALRRKAERCVVTSKDWQRLVDRYRGCCAYCDSKEKLTMEHIVPISRGGRHSIGNLLPVCMSCNTRKNAKLLIEWKVAS